MDYKDSLKMPNTLFPMRGNLGVSEEIIEKKWDEINLYQKVLDKNKGNKSFILHDGPPYANNDIHIGHAFQKTLKDFVIRYKTLSGFYTPYIPGYDTHGLPIENEVIKKGVNRKKTSILEFRQKCYDYALTQVEKQQIQFKRLGILGDFLHPYITLDKTFEADQVRTFASLVKNGLIYQGLKPVYWSPSSESAFAEAEIEYKDIDTDSIYLSFELVDLFKDRAVKLLVWTTTPWTLPGNVAICVNKDLDYLLIENNNNFYILASDLYPYLKEFLEFNDSSIITSFKGSILEYLKYKHPLIDRTGIVILGDHVTNSDGTGLVHTAPGHGEDDYIVGKKYNLEVLSPIDENGKLTSGAFQYEGLFFEDADKVIIADLINNKSLIKIKKINHAYPHDWRTHKKVIFRSTPQWFCSIEPIREEILEKIKEVKWYPSWGEVRLSNMIKSRGDWVISRQRAWGVPLPIIYDNEKKPLLDYDLIMHFADLFEEFGSNVWYEREIKDLLPASYLSLNLDLSLYEKEVDIMDVWFDSGTSYNVLKRRGIDFPADLYLEGSDQYRGWFNSSLITSVGAYGVSPYKEIVSHGFVLDGNGIKMSKSVGNTIEPLKVIKEMGADLLRLWVSSVYYQSDVRISKDMLTQVGESYRKIRNTIRYIIGNLFDFDPAKNYISFSMRGNVSRIMTMKHQNVINSIIDSFDTYQFDHVFRTLMPYINNDLSAFYLDFTKDILYIEHDNSFKRESVQSTLYDILMDLLVVLNPIIPHTTSEAYSYLPFKSAEDVYLLDMPKKIDLSEFNDLVVNFKVFEEIRELVLKSLEVARKDSIIGKSLEAKLELSLTESDIKALSILDISLEQLLIVSKVNIVKSSEREVRVSKASGNVCPRCWNIIEDLEEGCLCERCQKIISKLEDK
jgi:isoleucyl-tRNA synthetase